MLLVSTAQDQILRELTSVGQKADSGDLRLFLQKAVDYFYQNYNFPTSKKITDLVLYPGVPEYGLPTGFVNLIEPRKPNMVNDGFHYTRETDIYRNFNENQLAVEYDGDTPFLVAVTGGIHSILSECEDTTEATISGDSSAVVLDNIVFSSGNGSLQFNIVGSGGSTVLTFSLANSTDISDFLRNGKLFLDLFVPNANTVDIASIGIKIGNNSSNYYSASATTRFRGNSIEGGHGLIGFNLQTAVETGSVDDTLIDWIEVTINHGVTGINGTYRMDQIFLAKGAYYELPYYSSYIIQDINGGMKTVITANDDSIFLPAKTENAVIYKTLEMLSAERWKESGLASYFSRELLPYELNIKAKYPRQDKLRQVSRYSRANKF